MRQCCRAAFECVGGWYGCEMFMCQHCPGTCNADLPGGYDWTNTPSSYDGTLPGPNMFESTPPEYTHDMLQMP